METIDRLSLLSDIQLGCLHALTRPPYFVLPIELAARMLSFPGEINSAIDELTRQGFIEVQQCRQGFYLVGLSDQGWHIARIATSRPSDEIVITPR